MAGKASEAQPKKVVLRDGQVLVLREAVVADAKRLISYLNYVGGESDNLLFGANDFHLTIEQEEAYIRQSMEDPQSYLLIGTIGEAVVSVSNIAASKRKRIAHNSELSLSVLKAYWHLGIGSGVMDELIRFARENPIIRNVSLGVKQSNGRAIELYKSKGFVKVGLHKDFFCIDGVYDDEILMDLQVK